MQKLSIYLVNLLLRNKEDKQSYREIYQYSMEIILSTMANIVTMLVFSLVLGIGDNVFWYCLFFLPFRFLFGGAHAKTHIRCILASNICVLLSVFFAKTIVLTDYLLILEYIVLLVAMLCNFYYGSVTKIGVKVLCLVIPACLLAWLHLILQSYENSVCATLGVLVQAMSFVIKNKKGEVNEEII